MNNTAFEEIERDYIAREKSINRKWANGFKKEMRQFFKHIPQARNDKILKVWTDYAEELTKR